MVRRSQGVLDRRVLLAVLLMPRTRPAVQFGHRVRLLLGQPRLQHLREQVVVAIPMTVVIERHEEQVGPIKRLQHRPAVSASRDRIAERRIHTAENRGVQQEGAHLRRLVLQHLLDQVVDDVSVVSGEPGDEIGDVISTAHRESRQLERRDPSLRAIVERGDLLRRQRQPHRAGEIVRRLFRGEPQVCRAYLDQITASPQPSEGKWRISAARQHQVDVRRQVGDQERESVVHRTVSR